MKIIKILVPIILFLNGCSLVRFEKVAVEEEIFSQATYESGRLKGIANLGIAQYPEVVKEAHPQGFANVSFTNTFGNAYEEIDTGLATGKIPFQEYALKWSDTHTFSRADFPFIVNEAKRFVPLVNKYPNIECAFSGATEHRLNKKDATDLAEAVLAVIPERCVYVNNPWVGHGAFITPTSRRWNEVHGIESRKPNVGGKFICNLDGDSAVDINVDTFKKNCKDAEVIFVWHPANNGRLNTTDPTPRPQRKAWPTPDLLRSLAFLFTDKGRVNLPRNWLWKSHADRHETPPEKRAYKPVLIAPVNVPGFTLRKNGIVIATSSGPLPFADGRTRYYFPFFGYKLGKELTLRAGNKNYGVVTPGFRQGAFR